MAIDLFCYATMSPSTTKDTLDALTKDKPELFGSKFISSQPVPPSALQREIAGEHGVDAASLFLVRLQDKAAAGLIPDVTAALKRALGADHVVILFENEKVL